jgi:hypothetical protein
MTTEQAEAFAQLRTLAAASRLRVRPDDEGWPIIPGRLGQIEYHDGRDLAVFTDRPRVDAKLWPIPGVRRHQTGDREMRALFPHEALEQVAGVIRARRRRSLSPERARRLGAQTAYRATSRRQDRAEGGTLDLGISSAAGTPEPGSPRLGGRTASTLWSYRIFATARLIRYRPQRPSTEHGYRTTTFPRPRVPTS